MKVVGVVEFLEKRNGHILLDVRTPAEYLSGHIPTAINLPLFSNEERVVVGTIYKQHNPEAAFLRGLDFAGAKMTDYVKTAIKLAPERKVAVHCWRGGKRSGSLGWLLEFAGFEVNVLEGGYKSYRKAIRESPVWSQLKLIVLGGSTGSGKTDLLHQLAALGEQVVDLEALAHHKGSSFGAIGQCPQPSIEQFENNLYGVISQLDCSRRIWIENESRTIGKIYTPDYFWEAFKDATLIELNISFEARLQRLINEYACFDKPFLEQAFQRIERRLGNLNCKIALEALVNDDFHTAATIALRYYDKSYSLSTERVGFQKILTLPMQEKSPALVHQLIQLADEQRL
ncbi:MAG: tRNA 2-selenouridine(34) synthase MnmH [Saprospiraceae bacterium]|nr:tRNA 2-selenouridine(34) synthase MnmH [Saprospiraceae bacterium]